MSKTTFKTLVVVLVAVWAGCVTGLVTGNAGYAALVAGCVVSGSMWVR